MLVLGLGRPEFRCALTDASARRAIPAESRGPQLRLFPSPPASGGAYELPELQEGDRPGLCLLFLVQRFRAVVGTGKERESLQALGSLGARPVDRRRSLPPWCGDRRLHLEGPRGRACVSVGGSARRSEA